MIDVVVGWDDRNNLMLWDWPANRTDNQAVTFLGLEMGPSLSGLATTRLLGLSCKRITLENKIVRFSKAITYFAQP